MGYNIKDGHDKKSFALMEEKICITIFCIVVNFPVYM